MQINKVHFDGKKTTVEVQQPHDDGMRTITIQDDAAPAPAFIDAFQALADDVLTICEIPQTEHHTAEMRQVKWHRGKRTEVTLTGLRRCVDGPGSVTLNAPKRGLSTDEEAGACLNEAATKRVNALHDAAVAFVEGLRQQGDLFIGEGAVADPELVVS